MDTLPGLDMAGIVHGPQEQATQKFIDAYRQGKPDNPMADFIYSSMLSLARNIDVQNAKGREISRNMTSLLGYIQQLDAIYPTETADDGLDDLMREMSIR